MKKLKIRNILIFVLLICLIVFLICIKIGNKKDETSKKNKNINNDLSMVDYEFLANTIVDSASFKLYSCPCDNEEYDGNLESCSVRDMSAFNREVFYNKVSKVKKVQDPVGMAYCKKYVGSISDEFGNLVLSFSSGYEDNTIYFNIQDNLYSYVYDENMDMTHLLEELFNNN